MNILYLCHRFPFPPQRGGKIRPFNMIRHLSSVGHRVTVCSLARSDDEARQGHGIAPYCADFHVSQVTDWVQGMRMLVRLPTPTPSSMGFFYSSALNRQVRQRVASEKWDLIFVHCSSAAQYVEQVQHIPKILDFGDMDSQKWLEYAHYKPFPLSLGYQLEGAKLRACEKRLAGRFDVCTTTTLAEWKSLQDVCAGGDTDWFPNGVDTDYFCPTDGAYDPNTISFIGRMDYYPNQECMARFTAQVWPELKALRPALKLLIVGADPTPAMQKLGALDGVTLTGSVPDVRPYVRKSALMVAPLKIARGTQNKILEAMAMGVPVVTSGIAAGGVDALPDMHLLVADTPQELVRSILRLVDNPQARQQLAVAGRQRMLSRHAWPQSMARLDRIIDRSIRNFSTHGMGVVA
ncbi:MAG: TIGR03087 family PEP-CTERM/XrtA system glycosyltransferase [Pseudomonadota bacterium]